MRKNAGSLPVKAVMIGPTVLWLLIFLLAPLFIVVGISFMTKNSHGGVNMPLTLEAYVSMANVDYVLIFLRSMWLAFKTTILCLVFGYPLAAVIAHSSKNVKPILVLMVMLPFWINSMIRLYGWMTMLRGEGIINTLLANIGIEPLEMLYTDGAVLLGMVYELLPFAVLPLYTSIEKIDPSLLEAACDLGAAKRRSFMRVTLPLTMPGIFAASIQTFIPALGLFYVSDMLGGGSSMYLGNLIKNQFLSARNWPLGAALSLLLIAVTIILMRLYTRVGKLDDIV
jgi:spermidine/putrescine transport system permease protein